MRRSFFVLAAAGSLLLGLSMSAPAHADDEAGPVSWQSMAGSNEYWNIAGNSLSDGAQLIDYPWTGGNNEWFYDVIMTDGYRVEQTKSSADGTGMCVADPASKVDAGIIQWTCGDFEDNWTVQWAENEPVYEDWELVNQSHDQLATWKYDKSQIFLENRDDSEACDTQTGQSEVCAQYWN